MTELEALLMSAEVKELVRIVTDFGRPNSFPAQKAKWEREKEAILKLRRLFGLDEYEDLRNKPK